MKVYLASSNTWQPIIAECDVFILAKDVDGVNMYVVKDGSHLVRAWND